MISTFECRERRENVLLSIVPQDTLSALNLITADGVKPHIVKLADDKYEGRGAGYQGERTAAQYIAEEFKKIALSPAGVLVRGSRSYFQEFKFHPFHPVVPWEMMTSRNVLGLIEGTDPMLKNEMVVVGAHYDGQGRTGQADPTRRPPSDINAPQDKIWNSANDNATSIAAILEIARAIKRGKVMSKRSILFIAFGAEEHGMAGSIYADRIDFARTAEAARYAMAMLLELANQARRFAYAASPIPDLGLIGHLASNADADAAGLDAEESGLKVTAVIEGLPSAEAGLQAGDLILEFANHRFRRSDTLAALVAKQREVLEGKFGNKLPITILRAHQRSQLVVSLRR